jgi:hypothetical protein
MSDQQTQAHRRLAILLFLSLAKGWKKPLALLRDDLDQAGYPVGMDKLRADAVFLSESELAVYAAEAEALALRERGLEVASGVTEHPGIAKPRPAA